MSRLALRYYLPLVQVALVLVLLAIDRYERFEAAHRPPQEVGWSLPPYERLSVFAEAFGFLNAPALTTVEPFFLALPPEPEWPFVVAASAILLFWFGVGRLLDRVRGVILSPPLFQRSALWRKFCWLATGVATAALASGILLWLFTGSEIAVLAFPLMIWSGLSGLILLSEMRSPRKPAQLTFLSLKS